MSIKFSSKILLLTRYNDRGASSRLRFLQYIPYLESNKISITTSAFFDDEYTKLLNINNKRSTLSVSKSFVRRFFIFLTVFKYDLIWIEKEIFPYLPAWFEKILKLIGKPYVVDYDDAIFHDYDLSKNFLVKNLLVNKISDVMKNAESVIVGNQYLANYAKNAKSTSINIVPTVVDPKRYNYKKKDLNKSLVIGWIGSRSTQKYLLSIYEALLAVYNSHKTRLLLVGATQEISNKLQGLKFDIVPWSKDNESELIQQMDIGIMPLIDGPWERGKCGYKLIQYMACSIPVIASSVGANIDIVKKSDSGFLAENIQAWQNSLIQLLDNPEERQKFGKLGRKAVENFYSSKVQAPLMRDILNNAVKFKS
jgi:glycosyltransferase involved in cell wall biosynthesis